MIINNKVLQSNLKTRAAKHSFFEEKQKWFNFEVNCFKTNIANISQKQCNY